MVLKMKKNADKLWEALHKLGKQIHDYETKRNNSLLMLLHMIYGLTEENKGRVKVSEIAKICDMAMAATSKAIRRLENEGYIERSMDDRDRRVVYISLTETGKKTYREMLEKTNDDFTRLVGKMGEQEAQQFMRLLEKLTTIIEEENNR